MLEWVKNHPYISGSLVVGLILLYIVLRNSGGGSTQVVQSGPSEALQAANLAAQTQQQQTQAAVSANDSQIQGALVAKQIDAATVIATTEAQKMVALTNLADSTDIQKLSITKQADVATQQINAQLQAAQFGAISADKQTQAAISIASINANLQQSLGIAGINAQVAIAGLQADVSKLALNDQLAGLVDTNRTNVAITTLLSDRDINLATINATTATHISDNETRLGLAVTNNDLTRALATISGAITINQQNVDSANYLGTINANAVTHLSDNQLAGIYDTNRTNLGIAGINAGVTINGQNLVAGIYNNLISTTGQVAITQSNNQTSQFNDFLHAFSAVDFNRGGSGGANQVQVWSSIFGKTLAPGSTSDPFAGIARDISAAFAGVGLGL